MLFGWKGDQVQKLARPPPCFLYHQPNLQSPWRAHPPCTDAGWARHLVCSSLGDLATGPRRNSPGPSQKNSWIDASGPEPRTTRQLRGCRETQLVLLVSGRGFSIQKSFRIKRMGKLGPAKPTAAPRSSQQLSHMLISALFGSVLNPLYDP